MTWEGNGMGTACYVCIGLYRPRNDPDGAKWAYLARWGGDCWTATGRGGRLFYYYYYYYYYYSDFKKIKHFE